jgi:hypothetical protein
MGTYFLNLCISFVGVGTGDACGGLYLSLRDGSRLFAFVRNASCSSLNLFSRTLTITSSATTVRPSVSRPKHIPSITQHIMFSTRSISRSCLLLAVLACAVAANPAPAPAVTEGPQAYVSYADLPAFSTLKPCAQGCLKYNGVYHCSCKSPALRLLLRTPKYFSKQGIALLLLSTTFTRTLLTTSSRSARILGYRQRT